MTKILLNLEKVLDHADCYSADPDRVVGIAHKMFDAAASVLSQDSGEESNTEVCLVDDRSLKVVDEKNDTIRMIIEGDQTPVRKLIHEQGEINLPVGIIMIGRNHDACAIHLDRREISRMHAVLTVHADGRMKIRDLESLNGTFVNDYRVIEVLLVVGDKIKIGQEEFVVG